ncbi:hypothetical protein AO501_25275 [Mycobacterium gordonae]|uniref:Uncharacterized protein n=1 Tax=Mycobacterium gordonae TaxID=1778 RepID=A0A0Q2M6T4_MYCGO|nr:MULTISPECIES: hypothetical protein [Mycobacterium]KQH75591.1 hypothetical protein AO501_25275 [Mycobacterium gordonae]MDP7732091.1 hypothetical protein [Mycobacterium sp. TY813]
MRTTHNQSLVQRALNYAVRSSNSAATGVAVDTGVYGNNFRDVTFAVYTATITDGTHTITVEESDSSGSNYGAVESWRISGTLPEIVAADDNTVFQFGVRPTKRYVRLTITDAGSSSGGAVGAVAILSNGGNNPVARS